MGTRFPAAKILLISYPSLVSAFDSALRRSPVDMCLYLNSSTILADYVPFPQPGNPIITIVLKSLSRPLPS